MDRVHVFGIRHHGPGSARCLVTALEELQPDLLLIEGPPEAAELLPLVVNDQMKPPVALLIYVPEEPAVSAYYPFAEYSPEWQAILHGLSRQLPTRMMDLSQSVLMALAKQLTEAQQTRDQEDIGAEPYAADKPEREDIDLGDINEEAASPIAQTSSNPLDLNDPLRILAEAAGYSESEQWWDHLVEQRRSPADVFSAILEAMTALRESLAPETHPIAVRREAAMRQSIREALRQGFQRIAVVCGAWHAPALTNLSGAKEDAALLKGLPKLKVEATWVPWTNARLTRQSGYGAGIDSPGWYSHLWNTESGVTERWMIRVARLLRAEDLDMPPASIIEAVRLAEALAALRGRPLPGLPELNEAALTTLCSGNPLPMRLIEEKLTIGQLLGSVPAETPRAPLLLDFESEVRRLRLSLEDYPRVLNFDLRKPTDQARSRLLHRLRLLEVPWGSNADAALQSTGSGRGGTFHETWHVKWNPEFSVLLIDAGQWGNTLADASSARLSHTAGEALSLKALTGLVEDSLLADLPEAVEHLMSCLQARAAVSNDIPHLMEAVPPLTNVLRYGNVRQTDRAIVAQVVKGLALRVCIGLPAACVLLNDEAAAELFDLMLKVEEAFARMDEAAAQVEWQRSLERLINMDNIHGLIAGRACRILLDRAIISPGEAGRRLGLGLSRAVDPSQATAWIEGFLRGSGQLLVHDNELLGIIDDWLVNLPGDLLPHLLPLLRRTFSSFTRPERQKIGERVRKGKTGGNALQAENETDHFDPALARSVLPLIARLLGLAPPALPVHQEEDFSP